MQRACVDVKSYKRNAEQTEWALYISVITTGCRLPPSPPPPLRVAKTGKNNLNEEITPLLPTGIGERFSQTISDLGHAARLRRCEFTL